MSALASRELTGPPDRVGAQLDALNAAGLLVTMGAPKRHPNGMQVLVVLRKPLAVQNQARQLPAPQQSRSPRSLTPMQRQATRLASIAAAVGGGLMFLVWLTGRAVSGATGWATSNPALTILIGFVVVVAGLVRLIRKRPSRSSRPSGGCPGILCHCAGCRGHR